MVRMKRLNLRFDQYMGMNQCQCISYFINVKLKMPTKRFFLEEL